MNPKDLKYLINLMEGLLDYFQNQKMLCLDLPTGYEVDFPLMHSEYSVLPHIEISLKILYKMKDELQK